jgi:hypothetical protein
MLTKKIVFLFTLLFALTGYAQKNFTVSADKVKAGDIITFTYVPAGAIANTLNTVEGVVYTMGSKGLSVEDIVLKNEGGKYTGSVKTDTSNTFLFFGFSANKAFDNNFNEGYWVQLYDGDKIKKGSNQALAQFYQFNGTRVGLDPDPAKAIQSLENEFAQYPENRKLLLTTYYSLLSSVKKEQAPALIQKEIEAVLKQGLKEESDYSVVQGLYTIAKLPQQAAMINSLLKEKFPTGKWTINETIQKFGRETDIAKKQEMLTQITQKINTDPDWKFQQTSLPFYKTQIPQLYINNKDWTGFKTAVDNAGLTPSQQASLYNNAAWEIQKTGENLKLAEEYSRTAINLSKDEWVKPSVDKPATLTKSQWDRNRERTYGMYADTYATVLYKMGEYKKAFPYAKESALTIAKGELPADNNTYALLAEKVLPVKKYKQDLEQFVKTGKATDEIKQVLKNRF